MLPRPVKKLFAPRVVYIGGRGSTLIISFIFSIIYSRLLGLENRAVLTFIFTIISLLVLGFTASLGLSLRERLSRTNQVSHELLFYFKNLFSLTFALLCAFVLSLFLYSQIVGYLSIKIYLIASLLLISSSFIQGMNDCLVALDKLRTVMLFEISQVITQIIAFIILEHFFDFSYINAVMFAITGTYSASGVIIGILIWKFRLIKVKEISTTPKPNFFTYCKNSIKVILPTILIDRMDKLLIAIFLPLSTLAKYSILLTFVSLFRFIPESISKMYFSKHKINIQVLKLGSLSFLILVLLGVGMSYFFYEFMILNLLGRDWLMPFDLFILVGLYELVRGIYVVSINKHYAIGNFKISNFIPSTSLLVFLSFLSPLIFLGFLGIRGIPIGLTLGYLLILLRGRWLQKQINYTI
ncbi:MAG: hypothetical protein O3A27_06705 [Actinomycetota bacterium]|nr:hypothetical protein [Actinomycetota bacterium]